MVTTKQSQAVIMKKLNNIFCRLECRYQSNQFKVRGHLLHWSLILLPGTWVMYGLSLLFEYGFLIWISSGLAAGGISLMLAYTFLFELTFNKDSVKLSFLALGFIPFKVIRSATKDLIIDHRDAKHVQLISPRKDYYAEDVKNNLRFSYITPWDGDEPEFYIDYRNKEIDFNVCCGEQLWQKIIEGLTYLETRPSHQA